MKTLEKEKEMQVEIHSLKLVKENLEKEIQNLHYSRVSLSGQVTAVNKELRDLESLKLMAVSKQNELQRKQDEQMANRLNSKAKNLEVIERQLNDREAACTRREEKLVDLDHRIEAIRLEALSVERLKKELKRKEEEIDARSQEIEARITVATRLQQDATLKLKTTEKLHAEALEMGYRNQDVNRRLAEREQMLKRAQEALEGKLDPKEPPAPAPEPILPTEIPDPVEPQPATDMKRKPGRPPKVRS